MVQTRSQLRTSDFDKSLKKKRSAFFAHVKDELERALTIQAGEHGEMANIRAFCVVFSDISDGCYLLMEPNGRIPDAYVKFVETIYSKTVEFDTQLLKNRFQQRADRMEIRRLKSLCADIREQFSIAFPLFEEC